MDELVEIVSPEMHRLFLESDAGQRIATALKNRSTNGIVNMVGDVMVEEDGAFLEDVVDDLAGDVVEDVMDDVVEDVADDEDVVDDMVQAVEENENALLEDMVKVDVVLDVHCWMLIYLSVLLSSTLWSLVVGGGLLWSVALSSKAKTEVAPMHVYGHPSLTLSSQQSRASPTKTTRHDQMRIDPAVDPNVESV